ncbi:MAG: hypothetical protein ACR2HP_08205 [Ilumatobacteraceae bacterium]
MTINEDELQALLGRALQTAEPVPDKVVTGARAAWTWRTIDEELAELVFDSASELTGVRSEDTARQLTFRAPGVEIEVMVVDDGARRVVGQLIPPGEFTVHLTARDQVMDDHSDRLGRFTFEPVPPGPVRISVTAADGGHVASTEWTLF